MDNLAALIDRSTPLVIPTEDGTSLPYYSTRVSLSRRAYGLAFRWNMREARWYMDLSDSQGSPIVSGLKLVTLWPLLRFYKFDPRTPPGELLVQSLTPDQAPPGLLDLADGGRCQLLYYDGGA